MPIYLLQLPTPGFLEASDKNTVIGNSQPSALVRNAAAATLRAGVGVIKALQLLERGRGVLSTPDELRTDVISPEEKRRDAASEFDNLTAEILETPGFESFVHPPSEAETYAAAHRGPIVVINTSHL